MKLNGRKVFQICNTIFMLFLIFITAYPMYYVIIASISDPIALARHTGALWVPLKPYTLHAYEEILTHRLVLSGFRNTLFILVVGTSLNVLFTAIGAFFLTIKGPMLKNAVTTMIIICMYFSGGMIPSYLLIKNLGMMDTLWSVMAPGLISTTNLIIMKTAFQSIPESLQESAFLDGASYFQILLKVMLPLSKATLAVMVLYYGVAHWNSWFNASIYLRDTTLYPIQLVARNMLDNTALLEAGAETDRYAELLKYALVIVVSGPILMVYPFIQKYFAQGVMIGAIKG